MTTGHVCVPMPYNFENNLDSIFQTPMQMFSTFWLKKERVYCTHIGVKYYSCFLAKTSIYPKIPDHVHIWQNSSMSVQICNYDCELEDLNQSVYVIVTWYGHTVRETREILFQFERINSDQIYFIHNLNIFLFSIFLCIVPRKRLQPSMAVQHRCARLFTPSWEKLSDISRNLSGRIYFQNNRRSRLYSPTT